MGAHTEVIVGILGQWASGKSTAAKILVEYLGGEEQVVFITDRELFARQAVNHILELEASKVKHRIEADGRQRLKGELVTVWLRPGEDLKTADLNNLLFDLHDDVFDKVPLESCHWLDKVRLDLGYQILARSADGKPIVIEAGFGTNTEPRGENPFCHTLADLFKRLEEAGVKPHQVKWIIVEASYETRSERNRRRPDTVSAVEFDRFAADGGDIDPDHQSRLEEQGLIIKRVPNDHDDIERFKGEIITAFDELFAGALPS